MELRGFGNIGLARQVRLAAAALAAVTLIRLVVAAVTPLAPDEAYYWVWSHALAPGYLDHPPMVALWIKAGTALLGQSTLGVRLLGPLAAAVASWMVFDAARVLFAQEMTGVAAAALLNASLLLGVGAVIITPDSPLLFFWTAALWAMARLAMGGSGIWWLAAGLFGGLALDSKYTALLLWIGVACWAVAVPAARRWLRRWHPWGACAIGAMLFAPVLAWNAGHGWAGLARQGGRVDDWQPTRAVGFLAELLGGQIGLATPLVWLLCMAGLAAAVRRVRDPAWSLLAALSVPPILVFVQHAIGDRVQGNWPAIIYPALAIAAGGLVEQGGMVRCYARSEQLGKPGITATAGTTPSRRHWWIGATALGFGMTALAYLQATINLLPLPPQFDPVGMRLAGWEKLAEQVNTSEVGAEVGFVAADGYGLASELAWWMPPGPPVVGTDARWALTTLPRQQIGARSGLLVRDSRRTDPPDPARWAETTRIATVTRPGGTFAVFRARASAGSVMVAALPCRRCLTVDTIEGSGGR